ncbi:RNA polymerase sigma factor, sigma-70 family [Parapedobacter koreensis]|uniref:RNA polymerase sigma factor, sigma-70 family n=1 Tax=Parapedobacter koreensis TaxID=332977 RepID=A0A1H7GBX0_9SPHI|nr:RNA polymerase sigma factor, sigma-70 family [Parapedobacter koreensis]
MSKSAIPEIDQKTVDGIALGDASVLSGLYKDYFPMVLNMVVQNNGTEEEAKDVFQEAVIVLYDKIKQGNFALSSKLKTYIYSVCRRLWLKQLTSQGRTFYDVSDYEEIIPVEEDLAVHRERDVQLSLMEQALDKLGEPCRTIIHDFYVLNLSMQEICEKFGYTNADNAKNQKYKCLQRLKKLFFAATK